MKIFLKLKICHTQMGRIRINLTQPTADVPVNNQHYLNGFIHESFGENNLFHDKFSDYNISSLQGGKLNKDKKTLNFSSENPHFFISGNEDFLMFAVNAFIFSKSSMFGMEFESVGSFDDFKVNKYFDNVITISPIIVKNDKKQKITVENGDFLHYLTLNCQQKLAHANIIDPSFKLEIINPHKSKSKCIWVGKIFNPCSNVRLRVYGKKKTRETLYNMGLGGSTGSGFGSVKIYSNN